MRRSASWLVPAPLVPALLLALFLLLLLTTGCTSAGPQGYMNVDELVRALVHNDVDPGKVVLPYGLTPEMQAWAEETAGQSTNPLERLQRLQERLLDPHEMALEYTWGYTGTAAEVFEHRRANCLAFTNLFVGMARTVGIPVYFLSVEIGETYRKDGDLVILSDHIAVGYGPQSQRTVFDFSENPDSDIRTFHMISDLRALAMFHSNRGAEALQTDFLDAAVEWGEMAVKIEPELASAWVNLGVAYRRQGDLEAAEEVYRRAIEVDPRIYSAYQNLSALLRIQGRHGEALTLEGLLEKAPNRNPFTYLTLGDASLVGGRLQDAEQYYRRALRLDPSLAEPYAALGRLALVQQNVPRARRWLGKAQKRDPDVDRAKLLAAALAR